MSFVGERLHDLREALGLSRNQLAREAGVSQGYLSDLENGKKSTPSGPILAKVAAALGTSTDYLLGLSTDPAPPLTAAAPNKQHISIADQAIWDITVLMAYLDPTQKTAVASLVRNLARPAMLRICPWLKRLPAEIQEKMLPLAAAGWHRNFVYSGDWELDSWTDSQLLDKCQAMLAERDRLTASAGATPPHD